MTKKAREVIADYEFERNAIRALSHSGTSLPGHVDNAITVSRQMAFPTS
jgi:hypothetical protein